MRRSSGIILPLFSLPSPYGVGTMGQAAKDFIDFLADAKQSWWQVLPVGPIGAGESPYQSPSAFAGNPFFIDLDLLMADELLTAQEINAYDWGSDPSRVDYRAKALDAVVAARKARTLTGRIKHLLHKK